MLRVFVSANRVDYSASNGHAHFRIALLGNQRVYSRKPIPMRSNYGRNKQLLGENWLFSCSEMIAITFLTVYVNTDPKSRHNQKSKPPYLK